SEGRPDAGPRAVKRMVLDASALISLLEDRSGGEVVEELLAESVNGKTELFMSVVNWGEVFYSTWRVHGQDAARQIAAEISQFPVQVMDADLDLTKSAAALHAKFNLPYADCFAAALSKICKAELVTADHDFTMVQKEIKIQFL
ncbi:MAG TPA: type II toxin-antitoxin system VapC family toxin, partial [Candidatus Acidoferrales bacterium]